MRAPYPTPDKYRTLYARYYDGRSVKELCTYLGDLRDLKCLDLCAGEGLATEYFLAHGAQCVWSVDESELMTRSVAEKCPHAYVLCATVESALTIAIHEELRFDRVVCRQGVNYWCTPTAIELLSACMETGSVFVFNTLNTKPSTQPRVRQYVIDERHYAEIAYAVGDTIHTVVACEGYEPHQSEIFWLSREFLHTVLQPHYTLVEHIDGPTSVYVCTKL